MTAFTFDTAYIVAHLQNDANERVKAAIRARLDEMIHCPDITARWNREAFETFCWTWSRDFRSDHAERLSTCYHPRLWTVDPYPFAELPRWRKAFLDDDTITETPGWVRHHDREDDIIF